MLESRVSFRNSSTIMPKAPVKKSSESSIFRFLGSIRLAIPLLAVISVTLIAATAYEAKVGTAIVRQQVYESPWFGALMFLLATNLFLSALSRYPWRGARKVGFALTHLGLVVLIAGSAAVIHLGVEGMLLVRTDSGPNDRIRLEGNLLEVLDAEGTFARAELFERADGSLNPAQAGPLQVMAYSENAAETARFVPGGDAANPAVRLSLSSDRMGQTADRWLAATPAGYHEVSLGPASLELVPVKTEAELQQYLAPPPSQAETGPMGALQIGDQRLDVAEILTEEVALENGLRLQVEEFWPDFRLDGNNRPANASDEPNNPAVRLQVATPVGTERWFLFASGDFPPIRGQVDGERAADLEISYEFSRPEDYLEIFVAPDDRLFYAANSSSGHRAGPLAIGEAVELGWADFRLRVEEFIPEASLKREVLPVEGGGSPAILVATPSGDRHWLPWNEPTALETAEGEIYAAFGPQLLELPFQVALEDFIVERNEGSESVAMWTSQVRLEDPARGEALQRTVWMNHPTWYRGWKLAQASWNPGDLQQSTLQVKREPAWVTVLTFGGAGLVVAGIATMFYGRSLRSWAQQVGSLASVSPTGSSPEAIDGPDSSEGVALGK